MGCLPFLSSWASPAPPIHSRGARPRLPPLSSVRAPACTRGLQEDRGALMSHVGHWSEPSESTPLTRRGLTADFHTIFPKQDPNSPGSHQTLCSQTSRSKHTECNRYTTLRLLLWPFTECQRTAGSISLFWLSRPN